MNQIRSILNLVDGVSSVNFGIWHAAVASSAALFEEFGIESWLVSPAMDASFDKEAFPQLRVFQPESISDAAGRSFFEAFDPKSTIVASHGCWQYPTRWGAMAAKLGFVWVYTPHGMLEPWSIAQKAWKKIPYYHLLEKPMAKRASLVRAVGKPELQNLQKDFPAAVHIPNGIYQKNILSPTNPGVNNAGLSAQLRNHFLFLARLHHKKNVRALAEAWLSSSLCGKPGCRLRIAGTDDGEKGAIESLIQGHPDAGIEFLGPVFGNEKSRLMQDSDFYVLPSLSEGFPTSVVEAAGSGLICLISQGCNFPELLEKGAAMESGISISDIRQCLEKAAALGASERETMIAKARKMAEEDYLWEKIACLQQEAFNSLLQPEKI